MVQFYSLYIRLLLCLSTLQLVRSQRNLAEVVARTKQEYAPSASWPGQISMPADSMLIPMYNARPSTKEPMQRINQGPPQKQLAFDKSPFIQAQYDRNHKPDQEGRIGYEQPPPSYQQPQMQPLVASQPTSQKFGPILTWQQLTELRQNPPSSAPNPRPILRLPQSSAQQPLPSDSNGKKRLQFDVSSLKPVPRDSLPAAQPWESAFGQPFQASHYPKYVAGQDSSSPNFVGDPQASGFSFMNPDPDLRDSDPKRVYAGQLWVQPEPRSAV